MRILILDIETSPILCYTWGVWQQNISPNMVIKDIDIMCVAAKWLGEKESYFFSSYGMTERWMLEAINELLDEADVVVGHNLSGFDMKHLRGRSLIHDIPPPSPYREIDTLRVARQQFKFTSNKLAELASKLQVSAKSQHSKFPGFMLWMGCMDGDPYAWEEMELYNLQDIKTTEAVYLKLRPYMKSHPNVSIFNEDETISCPKCGSSNSRPRGYTYTNSGKYQRYRCSDCGGWHRSRRTALGTEVTRTLTTNIT